MMDGSPVSLHFEESLQLAAGFFNYLLLDEVLAQGCIEIKEVSTQGTVPDLKVINTSPMMILILDGEELVGAKQNRIVNTTILIKGNTEYSNQSH